ncbi:MAG: aminomethyl-transferring glycine dehydrogenase subunit GcvPB [Lentisphaerae bacterium]|nr:aminomethyl-transferring glycine dehydrogenase subunit GcvPB [Lentisphaerota bacterium]
MKLIYEKSAPGRQAARAPCRTVPLKNYIDSRLLRAQPAGLPEVPEIEVVRHFVNLSRMNYSVDTHFYPLGSCTMKYNPKACEAAAGLPGFADIHPLWPQLRHGGMLVQGALRLLYETGKMLSELTGMAEVSLQPMAGAHGELTGAMIIAAYHRKRGSRKTHILIPDSAHGTNPASAALAGFEVVAIPSNADGVMDPAAVGAALKPDTAGMMMTNPNTLGLFEPNVKAISELVHSVDGLMYYDGANFNAILGRCKPADMGFDVCHLNLHKTFATPHGGGGPGAGPVGVVEKLRAFLPISRVIKTGDGTYSLDYDQPDTIGYVAPFYGNFGVVVRTYAYLLMLGREGLRDVSNRAVLNANYILEKLRPYFDSAAPGRCMHECVISARRHAAKGARALDISKALIDKGFHPPTMYFPAIVPEALMIEPTETETRETLDAFVDGMIEVVRAIEIDPERLHAAPVTTPVGRVDEVAAARALDIAFSAK